MAENEELEKTAPKGNEWEVVSLTASAYAASPGPDQVDVSEGGQGKLGRENEATSSNLLFMSGHFVFPPSQHENLPVEAKYNETETVYRLANEEITTKTVMKDEKHTSIEGLVSDDFPEIPIFDEKGNVISGDRVFDEELDNYNTTKFSPLLNSEERQITDSSSVEPLDHSSDSSFGNFKKLVEGCEYDDGNLPCEAWWKRRAFSLYTHAKEANAFWSIFVAAAVMGLVIIGHRWQQERWQILHLKWQAGINRERIGRVLGPISRFKDVIVGGHRQGSLTRGSASAQL